MQQKSLWHFFQSNNQKNQTSNRVKKNHSSRILRLESLEERQLLSVTPAEYDQIRSEYSTLQLAENQSDVNIIEIADLTASELKNAIQQSTQTAQNDLIVMRTTNESYQLSLNNE